MEGLGDATAWRPANGGVDTYRLESEMLERRPLAIHKDSATCGATIGLAR